MLPTLGGQTALNLAMELHEHGRRATHPDVEMIGANAEAIGTAEDRETFKQAMQGIGLQVPPSGSPTPSTRRWRWSSDRPARGHPPAYILGGKGTGIASTPEEFGTLADAGLDASPITEILIEKSIAGGRSTSSRSCATAPTTA